MSANGTANRNKHYSMKENSERIVGFGAGGRVDIYENQEYKKQWLKKRNPDTK